MGLCGICGFFHNVLYRSGYVVLNNRMIAGSELRIGKYPEEAFLTSYEVVFRKLPGGTEEEHKIPCHCYPLPGLSLCGTSWLRSRSTKRTVELSYDIVKGTE
jgi:hypothetical protein